MKKLYAAQLFLLPLILAATGCSSLSLDCAKPEVFCVGLVTEVGRRDDRAYNQAAWEGILQAKTDGVVTWAASIETIDTRDYGENISVFAKAGYDAIVTVGYGSSTPTNAAAGQSSNIYFIAADQRPPEDQEIQANLAWIVFPEDQLGFLAGALAAQMTSTGKIGAVCGSNAIPSMKRYGDGFIAGALYVNQQVNATVSYHNDVGLGKTFSDPEWGKAAANSLVDDGADIIFGVGGATGSNAVVAAVARNFFGIGADIDEYFTLPAAAPHLYTSVMKLITPAVNELIVAARGAQNKTSVFPAGTYVGQIGLAPYHDLDSSIPEEIKFGLTALLNGLRAGDIQTGTGQ